MQSPVLDMIKSEEYVFSDNKTLPDICLIASDGMRFRTQKSVLSAASECLTGILEEDAEDGVIKIHELNGKILKHILAYVYTSTLDLQDNNVKDIFRAANTLDIEPLVLECIKFMNKELGTRNCLGISFFAEDHHLRDLHQKAFKFTIEHFAEVQNENEFLELNLYQLSELLYTEDFSVSSEETVFLGISKWIEHDPPSREEFAYILFSKVQHWLLTPDFIKLHRSKLTNQIETSELLHSWLKFHKCSDNPDEKVNPIDKITKPKEKNRLVAIFYQRKHIFNPELDTWTLEDAPEIPYWFDKLVLLNNKLFCYYLNKNNQSFEYVDLQTKKSTQLPSVFWNRCKFALAVLNEELYIVGGRFIINNEYNWTEYVEKYDFSLSKWKKVVPMPRQLTNPQAVVTGGLLYVAGNERLLLCFNPSSNKWTKLPFMCDIISDFGLTALNGKLYLIGGKFKCKTSKSKAVYSYDPTMGSQWQREVDMKFELTKPKCTSWNNQLIVFGGYDNSNKLKSLVQKYDPELKEWKMLSSPTDNLWYDAHEILNI